MIECISKAANGLREIWLAGGCFWGTQAYIDSFNGVVHTSAGMPTGIRLIPHMKPYSVKKRDTRKRYTSYMHPRS